MAVELTAASRPRFMRKRPSGLRVSDVQWSYAMLLPFLVGTIALVVLPTIGAFGLSFFHWDMISPPAWAGAANFAQLMRDTTFWAAIVNTAYFTVVTVPLSVGISLILAGLMNHTLPGMAVAQTVFLLPSAASIIALGLLWSWLYVPSYGLINYLLGIAHLPQPKWLASYSWAMPAVIIMTIWRALGFNIVVYISALQGIPDSVLEAARVDGASPVQAFLRIVVPMLRPVTVFITLITSVAGLQVFDQMYIMTNGGPGTSTTSLVYYLFQVGFENLKMGYASVLSVVLFIISLAVVAVQMRYMD